MTKAWLHELLLKALQKVDSPEHKTQNTKTQKNTKNTKAQNTKTQKHKRIQKTQNTKDTKHKTQKHKTQNTKHKRHKRLGSMCFCAFVQRLGSMSYYLRHSKKLIRLNYDEQIVDLEWRKTYKVQKKI